MEREPRVGKPKKRTCVNCGKEWTFYYRDAMKNLKDGNPDRFNSCSECAARGWHSEVMKKIVLGK